MEDHKIGEKFKYDGKTYRATPVCNYCALSHVCSSPSDMKCDAESRKDNSEVCYEEVKLEDSKLMKTLRYIVSLLYFLSFFLVTAVVLFLLFGREYFWLPVMISCVILYIGNSALMDKEG